MTAQNRYGLRVYHSNFGSLYICMTPLGTLWPLFTLGPPASVRGPMSPNSPIDSCFRGPTCSLAPAGFRGPIVTKRSR